MSDHVLSINPLERIRFLRSLDALRGLAYPDVAHLAQIVGERFFVRGETLLQRGEQLDRFHIIVEGRVRVDEESIEGPGDSVGFLALVARTKDGIEAVAETDVRALEIFADVLFDLFEDRYSMYLETVRNLAREMLELRKQIPDGSYLGVEARALEVTEQGIPLVDRLVMLRRGGVFRRTGMDALVQLASRLEEFRCEAGTKLWSPGEPSGLMYSIVSGVVRCKVEDSDRVFRIGPGYPMGNLESQAGRSRWYEAVTETPVVALIAQTANFLDILEDHSELAIEFLSALADGLIKAKRG